MGPTAPTAHTVHPPNATVFGFGNGAGFAGRTGHTAHTAHSAHVTVFGAGTGVGLTAQIGRTAQRASVELSEVAGSVR